MKRQIGKKEGDKKSMVGVPILLNLIKLEFLSSCLLVNRLVGARARVLDAWSGRASFVKIFVFFSLPRM